MSVPTAEADITQPRREVRPLVFVDGRRDRHDEHAAILQVRKVRREAEHRGALQLRAGRFERAVAARLLRRNALGLHIEADGVEMLAELDRQRQADISKTYDADAALAKTEHDDGFLTVLARLASESKWRPRDAAARATGLPRRRAL